MSVASSACIYDDLQMRAAATKQLVAPSQRDLSPRNMATNSRRDSRAKSFRLLCAAAYVFAFALALALVCGPGYVRAEPEMH